MSNEKHTRRLEDSSMQMSDPDMVEAVIKHRNRLRATSGLGNASEVLLMIYDQIHRLEIRDEMNYLLGRFQRSQPQDPHVDLTTYDAANQGVSRIHAQIHMEEGQLYLTDLDSTNGTFIDDLRLLPHQPTRLYQSAQIRLGKLNIQVMYRSKESSAS